MIRILLFGLLLLLSFSATLAQKGFVHRVENKLVAGDGKEIELNGVNLGGWLLWEGWIWGGGFKSEKKIDEKVSQLYGRDSVQVFKELIHENYITEADIAAIASMEMNTVRVPFNHTLFEDDSAPYVYKESGFALLDSLFSWCAKYKVYAVPDLHGAPGGQNSFFISDPDKKNLWASAEARNRTVALWYAIAKRYKDNTSIAGFDLLNEPKIKDGKQLFDLYRRITDTIRLVDKNHLLIYEGNHLAQKFDSFTSFPDENIAFSFHYYTWFNEKDKMKTLQPHIDLAKKWNVPFWCGEWGEDGYENLAQVKSLLALPDDNFCGEAFWTWKKTTKPKGKPALCEWKPGSNAQMVLSYITGSGKKPSAAVAKAALEELKSSLKAENCYINPVMVSIMKLPY